MLASPRWSPWAGSAILACGLGLGWLAGCSTGTSATPVPTAASPAAGVGMNHETPAVQNGRLDETNSDSLASVPGDASGASEQAASKAAPPVENIEARTMFNTLVTPEVDSAKWETASQGLITMQEAAIPVLLKELTSDNAFHRETAAMTIALMGTPGPTSVAALKTALEDPSDFVRAHVATALVLSAEHVGDAIPVLVELLGASDANLRQMAATNLSVVGELAAPHAQQLTAAIAQETSSAVLLPILDLLGRLGPVAKGSIPELERIAHEQSGDLGAAATHALNQIKQAGETVTTVE